MNKYWNKSRINTRNNQIKAVIFDMGNVVLKVDHMIACKKFSNFSDLAKEEIYKEIIGSKLEDSFERGNISAYTFYKSVIKKIRVNISFESFSNIFNDVFTANHNIIKIIPRLKNKVKIMLLSNTNILHFSWVDKKFDILKEFNERVLSYKIGSRKPEKEIFLYALNNLGYRPDEILYIDDVEQFICESKKLGINAILFESYAMFKNQLTKYFTGLDIF